MNLRERYTLWRLTPAEQLLYRSLKTPPEEWVSRGDYCISNNKLGIELWVGTREEGARVFSIHCSPFEQMKLGKFAKKTLWELARAIKYPPPPSQKELQRRLFDHLMKRELGTQ